MKQRKILLRHDQAGYVARFNVYGKVHETAPYKKRISAIMAAESLVNSLTAERYIFKIA